MSNKIITAEELAITILLKGNKDYSSFDRVSFTGKQLKELAVEFAKLHVQEALEECFLNSEMRVSENDTNETPSFTNNYDDGYVTITISKESILNAYPLENIK